MGAVHITYKYTYDKVLFLDCASIVFPEWNSNERDLRTYNVCDEQIMNCENLPVPDVNLFISH